MDKDDSIALFVTEKCLGQDGLDFVRLHPELKVNIELELEKLKNSYLRIGLKRQFDLKDMMIELQEEKLIITPLDFERVKYNENIDLNKIVEICNDWNIDIPQQVQDMLDNKLTI